MAFYQGYVVLPTNTYLAWKNAVLGNGYDADYQASPSWGCQCWDLASEFWYNVGFPAGYPHTGPNHSAYECWTVSRIENCTYDGSTKFVLINDINNVKQGDILVWNQHGDYTAGHIAFADENYDGSGTIAVLGQNQGSGGTPPPTPYPAGGTTANVKRLSTNYFLGAFRYTGWVRPSSHPRRPSTKRFPWVVYAGKNRRKQYGM